MGLRGLHNKRRCTGKLRYRDNAEAQLEIDRAVNYRGETLRAYSCKICGKVHLTSMKLENFRKFSPRP